MSLFSFKFSLFLLLVFLLEAVYSPIPFITNSYTDTNGDLPRLVSGQISKTGYIVEMNLSQFDNKA